MQHRTLFGLRLGDNSIDKDEPGLSHANPINPKSLASFGRYISADAVLTPFRELLMSDDRPQRPVDPIFVSLCRRQPRAFRVVTTTNQSDDSSAWLSSSLLVRLYSYEAGKLYGRFEVLCQCTVPYRAWGTQHCF